MEEESFLLPRSILLTHLVSKCWEAGSGGSVGRNGDRRVDPQENDTYSKKKNKDMLFGHTASETSPVSASLVFTDSRGWIMDYIVKYR